MNRSDSWARSQDLRTVRLAFAHTPLPQAAGSVPTLRRHRLALACATAFALGTAAPAWSATCPANSTALYGSGVPGADGADGNPGAPGSAGGSAYSAPAGQVLCVSTSFALAGGQGGNGGNGVGGGTAMGGTGGAGGIALGGNHFLLTNEGQIKGGQSGTGGTGPYGGDGGAGGGAVSANDFVLDNNGEIVGGTGGAGGVYTSKYGDSNGGHGGIAVSGSGFKLINTNLITGGAGGKGGTRPGTSAHGTAGSGGIGVEGTGDSAIINARTIEGGLDGDGNLRAPAVVLSGGGNTLTLEAGYAFVGAVTSNSGNANGDTLVLGGDVDGSFSLDDIGTGATAAFSGFARYAKAGTGTWLLTGTNVAPSWDIEDGALELDSGSEAGDMQLDGGTLSGIGTAAGITLADDGRIAPGATGGTGVGTLAGASLDWQSTGGIDFQLGATSADSDLLQLSGTLTGSGDGHVFAFTDGATDPQIGATYTLITFADTSGLDASDFTWSYSGTISDFDGSFVLEANALKFVVQRAQAIGGFHATPPAPTYSSGASFTVAATGGASGEPVVFGSATPTVCTVSGSTASILAAGTCTVTADQAGDATHKPAPQQTLDVTIAKAAQAIDFPNPGAQTLRGSPLELDPKSDNGLAVTLESQTPDVCAVSGSGPFAVTLEKIGTCTLMASQPGNGNYEPADSVSVDFAISAAVVAPVPTLGGRGLALLGLLLGLMGARQWRRKRHA